MLVLNCIHGNAPRCLSDSIDMASHMNDRNTRLNRLCHQMLMYHWVEHITCAALLYIYIIIYIYIYIYAVAWNALPNAVKDSGSLSAFRINLKRHIRTL